MDYRDASIAAHTGYRRAMTASAAAQQRTADIATNPNAAIFYQRPPQSGFLRV